MKSRVNMIQSCSVSEPIKSICQALTNKPVPRAVVLVHPHQKAEGGLSFLQSGGDIWVDMIKPTVVAVKPDVVTEHLNQSGENTGHLAVYGEPKQNLICRQRWSRQTKFSVLAMKPGPERDRERTVSEEV